MPEDDTLYKGEIDEGKKNEVMFLQMVLSLQTAAWIHLGKIPDHTSGKFERDMYLASAEIDMLMMLKEKTKGNLSDVEKNTLNQIVQQLQVNYLNELEKDKKAPADKKDEASVQSTSHPSTKGLQEETGGKGTDDKSGKGTDDISRKGTDGMSGKGMADTSGKGTDGMSGEGTGDGEKKNTEKDEIKKDKKKGKEEKAE